MFTTKGSVSIVSVSGYMMLFLGILLVPIFIFVTLYKYRTGNCVEVNELMYSSTNIYWSLTDLYSLNNRSNLTCVAFVY